MKINREGRLNFSVSLYFTIISPPIFHPSLCVSFLGFDNVECILLCYRQLHVVGRTFVRHQPAHVLLEEGLSPHHQVREYGLVGRVVTEMLVAREYIVHEGSTAAPVSQNEYRVVFQRFVGQQLLVTAFLQGGKGGKQTAYGLGQAVFAFVGRVDGSASGNLLESFPVGSTRVLIGNLLNSSNPMIFL